MILILWLALLAQAPEAPSPEQRDAVERLLRAATDGDLETVKQLVASGVDIESGNRYGMTPFYLAARRGHLDIVEYLVGKGAKIDVTDTLYHADVLTALLLETREHPHMVGYLRGKGIALTLGSMSDMVKLNHHATLKALLAHEVPELEVVLQAAAGQGHLEMVRVVLDSGKLKPEALVPALANAHFQGHREIAALLKKAGAPDPKPVTPAPKALAACAGSFYTKRGTLVRFEVREGRLFYYPPGEKRKPLRPLSERRFVNPEGLGSFFTFSDEAQPGEVVLKTSDYEVTLTRGEDAAETSSDSRKEVAKGEVAVAVSKESTTQSATSSKVAKPGNWPQFRGPGARGVADGQNVPTEWGEDRNIAWKVRIPGLAHASPVVWGDTVYVATAVNEKKDPLLRVGLFGDVASIGDLGPQQWVVMALDKHSGELEWSKVATAGKPKNDRHSKSTHANSTPVVDDKHLVVLFGSEGLFCFDHDGNVKWRTGLGLLEGGWFFDEKVEWGHGSSPVLYKDTVIVQCDRSRDSFLAAYRLSDGSLAWKVDRDEIPSWGSPTVVRGPGGDELVTNGTVAVRGYDPANGSLRWWLEGNSEIAVPTPFVHGEHIVVTNGYRPIQPIFIIKPGRRGDLSLGEDQTSNDHVVWSKRNGGPYLPTPVAYEDHLYVVDNRGTLSCYAMADGTRVYRKRLGPGVAFTASALAADGRLYLFSEYGQTFVIQTGKEYKLLAKNELNDHVLATPAMSDGYLFIRGQRHLTAVGKPR
ncbi:PQQ-binding-like beta-propeller repeat protein [Sulfidibacter corallicola]|uniref:PQQ-binding-like beta-propeller repeat protein n=1 Tax=Sulfidibacter corallicola TaxID=2818388 RepID=A0A8A4TLY6_SULCO|nr:PQQ-binding-like beta-propeller repeat protein [Sulfidibacter corallicola]QTD50477.1 PQQ-binding-like beta-propeller repeat protein [Sulfidibacter corallicola]